MARTWNRKQRERGHQRDALPVAGAAARLRGGRAPAFAKQEWAD
jgi:hypothetical protein